MLRSNSPVGRLLSGLLDQIILSILFLLCSLPVVTIPGSAIALYETEMDILENGSGVVSGKFFRAFGRNFLRGLAAFGALALMVLVMGGVCGAFVLLGLPRETMILLFLLLFLAVVLWLLLLLARFDAPLRQTVGNAFALCLSNPLTTLGMLAVSLIYPALFLIMPAMLLEWYLFILLFFHSGVSALGCSFLFLRRIGKKYADAIIQSEQE